MIKSIEILTHVFFWIAFTALTFLLSKVYLQADPNAPFSNYLFYVIFLDLLMGLILFYLTFSGIRWACRKKARWIILSSTLLILLIFFAIPAMSVSYWSVLSSVIPHIVLIFLAVVFRKFSDSLRLEKEKNDLLFQNVKAELALLKMQLSPHFLFNTLNNIDFLVSYDPARASDSIAKLGTILRYMIYETEVEKIDLLKEIKQIEDYIELLRLRSASKNFLNFKTSSVRAGQLLIAPMLFMPLIENSFKHCSTRDGDDIIDIEISLAGKSLTFTVSNEFSETDRHEKNESGLGLNNVKRRLELIYPDKHRLEVEKKEKRFIVGLKMELDEY
jgi:two-component system, LytTR family, sensor kinase